jgi:hypothetical protein
MSLFNEYLKLPLLGIVPLKFDMIFWLCKENVLGTKSVFCVEEEKSKIIENVLKGVSKMSIDYYCVMK